MWFSFKVDVQHFARKKRQNRSLLANDTTHLLLAIYFSVHNHNISIITQCWSSSPEYVFQISFNSSSFLRLFCFFFILFYFHIVNLNLKIFSSLLNMLCCALAQKYVFKTFRFCWCNIVYAVCFWNENPGNKHCSNITKHKQKNYDKFMWIIRNCHMLGMSY